MACCRLISSNNCSSIIKYHPCAAVLATITLLVIGIITTPYIGLLPNVAAAAALYGLAGAVFVSEVALLILQSSRDKQPARLERILEQPWLKSILEETELSPKLVDFHTPTLENLRRKKCCDFTAPLTYGDMQGGMFLAVRFEHTWNTIGQDIYLLCVTYNEGINSWSYRNYGLNDGYATLFDLTIALDYSENTSPSETPESLKELQDFLKGTRRLYKCGELIIQRKFNPQLDCRPVV